MTGDNLLTGTGEDNPLRQVKDTSVELEMALIGAALVNQAALDSAAPFVASSDFSDPWFSAMWDVMLAMHGEGIRLTPMLVGARISSPEAVETVQQSFHMSPMQLMSRMAMNATTVVNAPDYAKQVRELKHRRDLFEAAGTLRASVVDPGQPLAPAVGLIGNVMEQALNAVAVKARSTTAMVTDALGMLDNDIPAPGVTSGLRSLDARMGGFIPGDLIVLGARPSMGKSAVAISSTLASSVASYRLIRSGEGNPWACLLLTFEMSHDQVIQRMLTDLASDWGPAGNLVEYARFRPPPGEKLPPLSVPQRDSMHKAGKLLSRLPIKVDGRPGMTITEVTALIRLHKKRFAAQGLPLRVVTADHIGMGKINAVVRAGAGPVQEIGEVTTALKACALTEDLCVLACHQLSRANEGRENKRPTLADFRDSGHIEQDADVMIGLYRDAYYLERAKEADEGKEEVRKQMLAQRANDLEAYVLKVRMGRVGLCDLYAGMATNTIRDKQIISHQDY